MICEDRAKYLHGFFVALILLTLSIAVTAQRTAAEPDKPAPFIKSLAEVSLGMSADQVKEKLGKPETSDSTGMLFSPSSTHTVQIGLDEKGTVRTIALIFTEGDKKAPSFTDVFGSEVEKPASSESVYKMVRYPEAGFWLSYSLSSPGDKPMTVVTMRRIE